jgi:hypothetical protein
MNHFWIPSLTVLVLILPFFSAFAADAPEKELSVGAASEVVNPPDGVFLGGYDLNRKSTGVHDDLNAKAVVFSGDGGAVALVSIDCFSLQYDAVNDMRAAASKAAGALLPPERIVIQVTHSHCAPDTVGIYGPDETHCGRDPEYMRRLTEGVAKAVERAAKNLKPARLVYAETECAGWAVNDSEPDVLDNSVTILQCLDARSGESIATMTNFACHPTVLDGDATKTGADWVAYFYKSMSALHGDNLFLQGAIGCWMQPKTPERTYELAEKYGADLAAKTLDALKKSKPLNGASIRFANNVFEVPVANDKFRGMSSLGLVSRAFTETVKTEVAWFSIGDAQFATHFGETAPMFAAETKKLMKTGPKFVLGLGLDHLGYICPPRYFENKDAAKYADYLTDMSPGPQAGPAMMDALKAIIP